MSKKSGEELAKELPPNATMRDIFDFCKKNDIHSLAQGMIELPPPLKLRQIAANIVSEGSEIHQYRNRFGEDEYRDALVTLQEKRYHTKITKNNILATAGVSGALVSILMHLKNKKGLENLRGPGLIVPFYTYHAKQITDILGKQPVYVNSKQDFRADFDEIHKALFEGPGLDLLIFTNPGNPGGNLWTREEILKLVEMTEKAGCLLLIDEIYSDLVWKGEFYSPAQDKLYEHVLVARGFAKSLAAQSWRCGYLIAHETMINEIMKIHDPIYISVPWTQHAIGQYITQHFDDFVNHIEETGTLMKNNWKILAPALQKSLGWTPIDPEGSMYGMFFHHAKSDMDAIVAGLSKGVGVAPGSIFWPNNPQNTGYIRIHCGITEEKAKEIAAALSS
eukprot:TRINITY_DN711_c2_g1_i1.p1 TRINITY_DN711_c2_g1~~TRINITY_DN711_c2_g1_i1.p1  ORF type:complete len:392 (-),score=137.42 TRINITY_DN711_c2_g1_i1:1011-2186(-)